MQSGSSTINIIQNQQNILYDNNNQNQLQEINLIKQQQIQRKILFSIPEFKMYYENSTNYLNSFTIEKIKNWVSNRQKQNYFYFVQPHKFVQFAKNQRISHFSQHNNDLVTFYLLQSMKNRQNKIQCAILNSQISISLQQKNNKTQSNNNININTFKKQENNLQVITLNNNDSKNEQKLIKQAKQKHRLILKQQKIQKQRLKKMKQLQLRHKRQKQQKIKLQQIKKMQQIKRSHYTHINQKITQNKQKRQKQLKQRQQRNKDYKYIVKQWAKNMILHQKMEKSFKKRYQQQFQSDRKKLQSQRTKLSLNARVQQLKIDQHQKNYLLWKSQSDAARAAKIQQQERLIQTYQKQLSKYNKPNKNKAKGTQKQDQDDQQSDDNQSNLSHRYMRRGYSQYIDKKQEQRKIAQQKRKKMGTYWKSFVKEDFQPEIDQKKRQELKKLIQSLQSAKKYKKVKNQKGQFVYQQLKIMDPAIKGQQYLDFARELGRQRKLLKRNDSDDKSSIQSINDERKKSIDYLKKLKQSRAQSLNGSKDFTNKYRFLQKQSISFVQKMQRVQRQAFKLQQMTKLSQNQLKYGKFKTSDQILQYKQDIDNNHVQILKLKIKLAVNNK